MSRYFFSQQSLAQQKSQKNSSGTLFSVVALLISVAMVLAAAKVIAQRTQGNRDLKREISALRKRSENLRTTLQNRDNTLERLMNGREIAEKARPLGLRTPDPQQRVVQMRLVRNDSGELQPRLLGSRR